MEHVVRKQGGERRKLQMTGGSTYIVSLPKKWITRNQLEKGSSLTFFEEDNGSLSILSTSESVRKEKPDEALIKVSPNENPDTIIRKTVSCYLVGYNMMHIRSRGEQPLSSKQRIAIKNFTRRLLVGTEIVIDTPTDLTLQVLLSYPELSIQSALRRMCIITSSMHKDALTALKEHDSQLAKAVIETDDEVDRFNMYVIRQLKVAIMNPRIIKEIGLVTPRDCLGYRLVTKSVERAADHAASIAEHALLLKKPMSEEVIKYLEEMSTMAVSMFETAIESLFRLDFNLAESVIQKTKEIDTIMKEALLSSQKTGTEEIANLKLVIESLRRTAEYASDIAEIVLNLTVDSIIG